MTTRRDDRLTKQLVTIAVILTISLPFVYSAIVVPLSAAEQAQVSVVLLCLAGIASFSRAMRPLIIFLSCFASMRYFYWRISSTVNVSSDLDVVVSFALLGAEIYGLIILFLGYFQTIEVPMRNCPPVDKMASVDVFIPTYNESVEIVRRTLIGAISIDYSRKQVYVLDDGRRPEMEELALSLGCGYITRPDNRHAKAGNLNHALGQTRGELIAIFDADHVPVRGFLQKTVGFFADPAVALVQTAQHFFNPDPFERNLKLTGKIAPEQHFFYHAIQPANDFWNSAFFCGSCAVLRRSAVEAIGGFKTTTVTEDAHTSLELHARGYRSVYLPMALAAGLATETYAAHVVQRVRWARGMAQILRTDCPLFKRGLSVPQRINYFSAMFHFFFGVPTLIMLLAPLTYLLFGVHPIKADALAVVAYILPHIGLCTLANAIISKNFRHSFWSGVYEVSIAPYVALATFLAMVYPRRGKFNVTEKGANLDEARFDFKTGRFTLALIVLSVCGLMIAFPIRLILHAYGAMDPTELNSLILNSAWALANLVTLVAAACVAYEQPQQRRAHRVKRNFDCQLTLGSESVRCGLVDLSESGVKLVFGRDVTLPHESTIHVSSDFGVKVAVRAALIRSEWASGPLRASFRFVSLDAEQYRNIVQLIFTGDESWTGRAYARDQVPRSCWYLATTLWRVSQPRTTSHPSGKIWPGEFDKRAVGVGDTL